MSSAIETPADPSVNGADLLSRYEAILRLSLRMQEAAREGDWDILIELEQDRAALLNQHHAHNESPADKSARAGLIQRILASDAETGLLVGPRQDELKMTFDSIETEKKLQKAYETIW